MSVLFSVASDFIDKVTNPAYGPLVNEDYSLKLGQLVNDESFLGIFSNEIKRVENVDELTPHAWIWVLRYCRTSRIKPSNAVLTALIKRWSSVFLQVLIIDTATFDAVENEFSIYEPKALENEWLIDTISQLTIVPDPDKQFDNSKEQLNSPREQPQLNTQPVENLLLALLQLESRVSLLAASFLISLNWQGRERLLETFWARFDLLDEETKSVWKEMLNPPSRPSEERSL